MTSIVRRMAGCYPVRVAVKALTPPIRTVVHRVVDHSSLPEPASLPGSLDVLLPGRGSVRVVDVPGPTPDAPVVLLLHAIATTGPLTWFAALAAVSATHRVVLFDQRWHGGGICEGPFALEDCADDAAAVLDALGIRSATVIGYSMGGATAQLLGHRHPEKVAGLILCSTAGRWRHSPATVIFYAGLDLLNRLLLADAPKRVAAAREVVHESQPTTITRWCLGELRRVSPWSLPYALAALGAFDSTEWIGEVQVPAAVIVTARDRAVPARVQRHLHRSMTDAAIYESPGGHASIITDRARWQEALRSALEDVQRRVGADRMQPSQAAAG